MDEDIFIIESFLKLKEKLLKHPCLVGEKTIQAIENLINKYKEQKRDIRDTHILLAKYSQKNEEQEKIIELMAKEINDGMFFDSKEEVIDYFKKKARENNEP